LYYYYYYYYYYFFFFLSSSYFSYYSSFTSSCFFKDLKVTIQDCCICKDLGFYFTVDILGSSVLHVFRVVVPDVFGRRMSG
jgi:hypothetical protein